MYFYLFVGSSSSLSGALVAGIVGAFIIFVIVLAVTIVIIRKSCNRGMTPGVTMQVCIITARISKEWGKVLFSQVSVCSHLGEGGTPIRLTLGTPPHQDWMGVPPIRTGWGYPPVGTGWGTPTCWDWRGVPPLGLDWGTPPPIRRQNSRVSTCYAAGGMPLAFTQEDFLVYKAELERIQSVTQRV